MNFYDHEVFNLICEGMLEPPGCQGFCGLADFSPDRASEDVLAKGILDTLYAAGYVIVKKEEA